MDDAAVMGAELTKTRLNAGNGYCRSLRASAGGPYFFRYAMGASKDWALEYGLAFSAAYCQGYGRLKTGAIFTWGYAKPLVKYPPHGL